MQSAIAEKGGWFRRAAIECGHCLRDPLRPVYRLIFWLAQLPEEDRAVRRLAPFRRMLDFTAFRKRGTNLDLLCDDREGLASSRKRNYCGQHMQYLARLDIHLMKLSRLTPLELVKSVHAAGEENIESALREGRGLLLISAHTGTFFHVPLFLAARGHPVRVIVNPGLPGRLGRYLRFVFGRFGAQFFYVGTDSYSQAREAFKKGEIVLIVVDHSLREDRSCWVPFGPVELPMDPGTAILALRQKVPVIWGRAHHDSTGRSCVEYSAPLSLAGTAGRATPESVLQQWAKLIYEQWKQHPEQWWAINVCSLRQGANVNSSQKSKLPQS